MLGVFEVEVVIANKGKGRLGYIASEEHATENK